MLLACTSAPTPAPVSPVAPVVVATAAPAPATLDEAAAKARAHAVFDAFDRADRTSFVEATGPAFYLFDNARFYDAVFLAGGLQARIDRHAPLHSRTCSSERVTSGPNVAVYAAECIEHVPAEGDNPAADLDNWHQLVWVFDGSRWKLEHWSLRAGGPEAEREAWNTVLRRQAGFRVTVNRFLAAWVKGKKPGAALDIAAGQGRNAVYLATQGWKVTAIDISDAGLELAKKAALAAKTKLTTVEADVDTWDLGKDRWDLVTLIYAGSNHGLIDRIKPSIKKGGWFVVEFFGKESMVGTGIGGFAPGELAKLFDGWRIEKDEVVDDIADWGLEQTKVARFAAQKP